MKRIARLLPLLLASALLLAGCDDIPTSLEEFVGWRDKFLLQLTPTQIQHYLGPILAVVVVITVIKTLFGILSNQGLKWFGWFMGQVVAIALLYYLPSLANTITTGALPPELTLDAAVASLHLGISSLDPTKALTSVWALGTITVLPVDIMLALLVDVILSTIILLWSAIWTKNKALWTILACLLGHWLFILILVTTLGIIEIIYPNWEFPGVAAAITTVFLGVIYVAGLALYVALPVAGTILGPNFGPTKEIQEREPRKKRDLDIEGLVPIFFPPAPAPQEPQTPAETAPEVDPGYIDGQEVVYPDDPYGPAIHGWDHGYNPMGLPTPVIDIKFDDDGPEDGREDNYNPVDPNPPSEGPSSPPTGVDRSSHPDWVPPIRETNFRVIDPANPPPQTALAAEQPVPTSEKIRRTKDVGNKAAAVVEIGAALLGHPEVAGGVRTARTAGNAALTAAEIRARNKEAQHPDWVP